MSLYGEGYRISARLTFSPVEPTSFRRAAKAHCRPGKRRNRKAMLRKHAKLVFFFSHNSDAVQKNDVDFLLTQAMSNASSTFHIHFHSYVGQACLPSVLPRSLPSKVGTRTLQFNYSLIASFVQRLNTRYPFSFGKVHFWVTPLSIRMLESALRSTYTSSLIYFIRKGGTADLGRSEFIGAQGPSNEKDRQINGVCIIQRFLP